MEKDELTALQVAERLGMTRRNVIYLIDAGAFPSARRAWPGSKGPWVIKLRDVQAYEKQKAGECAN